jgi:hypothetical protein
MTSNRIIILAMLGIAFAAPSLSAQDLSTYREFHLGARLPVVAKQARLNPADAKTLHQRPALIQELEWQAIYLDSNRAADSVRNIMFSFYNGELFRLLVSYDRERTEGLSAEDIIEAISAKYGVATKPGVELTLVTTYLPADSEKIISERKEKVIARWEDDQYSYNLLQAYPSAPFSLAIYAKRVEALAAAAVIEALRLDKQEAPQIEAARQMAKAAAATAKQAKARRLNKPPFRP